MTVPTTTSAVSYTGTGLTATYSYSWAIAQAADLVVYTIDAAGAAATRLTLTTDYSVTGVGVFTGGTIVLTAGNLAAGAKLFIGSDPSQVQQVQLSQGAGYNPADVMNALDLLTREVQATRRIANNAVQFPVAESLGGVSSALPTVASRASKFVGFDSLGNVIAAAAASGAVVSAAMIPVVSAATTLAARTAFGIGRIISVADYGAIGDGATNAIAAFRAAAAAMVSGDTLLIPYGDYVFDFSSYTVISPTFPSQGIIGLSSLTRIKIAGDNAKLRITNLVTATKGGWSIIALNACSDVTIEGLRFDLRGITGLGAAVPEPSYPIISAVYAVGTTWRDLTIRACEFTSRNSGGADGGSTEPNYFYKQIPVFAQGDSAADAVRGLRFNDNLFRDVNTYKVFLLGVGGTEFRGNKFLDIAGNYPAIRNLVHCSRGHVVADNYFEGLKPADEDAPNKLVCTDTPQMVLVANATNKGGGGAAIIGNTFSLTGSGGISLEDCNGAALIGNTFCDRVDMSSKFTIENDVVSCIRLLDESAGSGSFPTLDTTIHGNAAHGTLLRKFIQITNALRGTIVGNSVKSAAGYAIKASKARDFTIAHNDIAGVTLFDGIQVGVSLNSPNVGTGEFLRCLDNIIHDFGGGTGTAIGTISFDAAKCFISGNTIAGVATAKTAGAQDQLPALDFIRFANDATRVSSGAADLDWYEEGSWTPVLTFVTPGNLAITYTTRIGRFERIGRQVTARFHVFINGTFTWTTSSGDLQLTGLPYANAAANDISVALGLFQGITKAGFTQFATFLASGDNKLSFYGCGTAASVTTVKAADMPSGGSVFLSGMITYSV